MKWKIRRLIMTFKVNLVVDLSSNSNIIFGSYIKQIFGNLIFLDNWLENSHISMPNESNTSSCWEISTQFVTWNEHIHMCLTIFIKHHYSFIEEFPFVEVYFLILFFSKLISWKFYSKLFKLIILSVTNLII